MVTYEVIGLDSVCNSRDAYRSVGAECAVPITHVSDEGAIIANANASAGIVVYGAIADRRAVVRPNPLLRVVAGFTLINLASAGRSDSQPGISIGRTMMDVTSRAGNESIAGVTIRRAIRDRRTEGGGDSIAGV